jgi:hypothetical protein
MRWKIGDEMSQIRQLLVLSTDCPLPELTWPVSAFSQKLASLSCDDGFCRAHSAPRPAAIQSPAGHIHAETV